MVAAAPDGSRETQSRDGGPDAFEVLNLKPQRMSTTNQWDYLNRLTSKSSSSSSSISFSYGYNNANQRTGVQWGDGSYWRFNYDFLGQVTSGHKFFADETPVAGQQFDYAFDTIGNRTQTKAGGDAMGINQRLANYSANLQNQYTARDVPGAVDIMGVSIATNVVSVNGQTAYRKGEYFRQQLNVNNTSVAVWTNITVSATGQSSQSGNQFVPKTQEQFSYDLDGNLTNDGRWYYTWDAENRLVSLTNNTSVGPQQGIRFEYDAKGRRIHKQVWGPGSGSPTNDVKFLYDGWNVVAILNSPSTLIESFLWGLDLSGSAQGAGGVGGLLDVVYYGASPTNCFVAFDGNGNVAALVDATNGTSVAQYDYGPFGELLRATGPMAKAAPFRFSTKYQDDETDLLYYGYRYFNASTGRWLSKDPIEAEGGLNEYASVGNDPVDLIDQLGLKMLFITIARDKTLPGAPGEYWSRKVKERTELMRRYLQNILERCLECSGKTPPTVMANFAPGRVLQAPAVGHWTIGDKNDEALMEADWNLMGAGGSTVRVFWTFEPIKSSGQGTQWDASGVSYQNKGIILSFRNSGRDREVLAHEVGHYAGYIGNAPGRHSSDPNNIMYKTHVEGGLNDPDTEYCEKVISLAK